MSAYHVTEASAAMACSSWS